MSDQSSPHRSIDLRQIAATTAVASAVLVTLALGFLLLDVLLLFFGGIVVAVALQPALRMLCAWGIPRAISVLLLYLLLLIALALIATVVGPMLMDRFGTFASEVPESYARVRSYLQTSAAAPLRMIGQGLPPFGRVAQAITEIAPQWFEGAAGVTATIVKLPVYFVAVLAIGFYWTMEVPRFERLFLSLLAVEQRPRALNVWHEIESKLGGYIRGQGLAMLSIGAASAAGYALIGLPNAMALGVLAGLFEAVPLIGPTLAFVPAVIIALPLGGQTVLLVIGFAVLLQLIENNVLIPRIMHQAVGVSALLNLLAVLAFGTLYGIVGILVAIPMTAVFQVLLATLVFDAEAVAEPQGPVETPWIDLRARVRAVRQQARIRLRARESRMGIDPATADHVGDAVDQGIEMAVARMEKVIVMAEELADLPQAEANILEKLRQALEEIAQAVDQPHASDSSAANSLGTEPHLAGLEVDALERAAKRFTEAVDHIEIIAAAAQETSKASVAADKSPSPQS